MSAKSFAGPPSAKRTPQIRKIATITMKEVRVQLHPGENYAYSQIYEGQKETISSITVTQGGETLWNHMVNSLYPFDANPLHETNCIEIVVIRNTTPNIEQVWTTGRDIHAVPLYFRNMEWTDALNRGIHTGDVIEIRLKPYDTRTPSPELAIDGKGTRWHTTPSPHVHKLHPANDPNLPNQGPGAPQAHFVAMRACLQRIEYE
jgi:hypothetical protein